MPSLNQYQLLFGMNKHGFVSPDQSGKEEMKLAIQIDAILSEAPKMESTLTKSPIETGEEVSDHVILSPDKLTIDGIISNTPLGYQSIGTPFTNPAKFALEYLTLAFQNRKPFDFVGGFKIYRNMILTSFNPERNCQTGDALHFTASMENVVFATSQMVEDLDESVEATASKPADTGNQPAEAASKKSTDNASLLFQGVIEKKGLVGTALNIFGGG